MILTFRPRIDVETRGSASVMTRLGYKGRALDFVNAVAKLREFSCLWYSEILETELNFEMSRVHLSLPSTGANFVEEIMLKDFLDMDPETLVGKHMSNLAAALARSLGYANAAEAIEQGNYEEVDQLVYDQFEEAEASSSIGLNPKHDSVSIRNLLTTEPFGEG